MSDEDFVEYVLGVYGLNADSFFAWEGVAPMTREEAVQALAIRRSARFAEVLPGFHYQGDSTDRELVRDIVLRQRGLQAWSLGPEPYGAWDAKIDEVLAGKVP